jgi:hypothetical protein
VINCKSCERNGDIELVFECFIGVKPEIVLHKIVCIMSTAMGEVAMTIIRYAAISFTPSKNAQKRIPVGEKVLRQN